MSDKSGSNQLLSTPSAFHLPHPKPNRFVMAVILLTTDYILVINQLDEQILVL